MALGIEKIKIKVKITEDEKMKAIITLNFGDFTIKGFRIRLSNYENREGNNLWVTPPAYRDKNGNYHPMFFMEEKSLWLELEGRILEEYRKELRKHNANKGVKEERKKNKEQVAEFDNDIVNYL